MKKTAEWWVNECGGVYCSKCGLFHDDYYDTTLPDKCERCGSIMLEDTVMSVDKEYRLSNRNGNYLDETRYPVWLLELRLKFINDMEKSNRKTKENSESKTAHWIIEDRGFEGQYYRCSECGDSWNDIYQNISMEETCPSCGATIDDEANEYVEPSRPVINKDQKLLETLKLFDGSMEDLLFYYINTHSEEFPASRINKLIRALQDSYISNRIAKLENACSVSRERATYLLKYLDGTMYKTEEAAALAKEAQIANAEAIIKICEGEEV